MKYEIPNCPMTATGNHTFVQRTVQRTKLHGSIESGMQVDPETGELKRVKRGMECIYCGLMDTREKQK